MIWFRVQCAVPEQMVSFECGWVTHRGQAWLIREIKRAVWPSGVVWEDSCHCLRGGRCGASCLDDRSDGGRTRVGGEVPGFGAEGVMQGALDVVLSRGWHIVARGERVACVEGSAPSTPLVFTEELTLVLGQRRWETAAIVGAWSGRVGCRCWLHHVRWWAWVVRRGRWSHTRA